MNIVLITLGINVVCIAVGLLISCLTLFTDWFDKYRIQSEKRVKIQIFLNRLPLIIFNIILVQIFAYLGVTMALPIIDASGFYVGTVALQFALFLLLDDMFFYGIHRTMHENEFLFRKIHKVHHKASTPFALEYMYVHPLEWMLGSVGVALGFIVCWQLFGTVNVYSFWIYAFFRNAHEIDIHSGLEHGLLRFLPFYGSAHHHDDHHAYVKGNYASSLSYLDKIFGTGIKKAS